MMAYLLPYLHHYLLPFLLHIECWGLLMVPFSFCCFLCCLSLCFALPGKVLALSLVCYLAPASLLCHSLENHFMETAAVIPSSSPLGATLWESEEQHLPHLQGGCFQPYCNDLSVSWAYLHNQSSHTWAVNLICFLVRVARWQGMWHRSLPWGSWFLGGKVWGRIWAVYWCG